MTDRRSFLRSLGVAVMAVSLDVLPRFTASDAAFADVNARLVASIEALIAVLDAPLPSAWLAFKEKWPVAA